MFDVYTKTFYVISHTSSKCIGLSTSDVFTFKTVVNIRDFCIRSDFTYPLPLGKLPFLNRCLS